MPPQQRSPDTDKEPSEPTQVRQPLADKPAAVNQQVKARGNHEDEAKNPLKAPQSQSQASEPSEQTTQPEHRPYNLETPLLSEAISSLAPAELLIIDNYLKPISMSWIKHGQGGFEKYSQKVFDETSARVIYNDLPSVQRELVVGSAAYYVEMNRLFEQMDHKFQGINKLVADTTTIDAENVYQVAASKMSITKSSAELEGLKTKHIKVIEKCGKWHSKRDLYPPLPFLPGHQGVYDEDIKTYLNNVIHAVREQHDKRFPVVSSKRAKRSREENELLTSPGTKRSRDESDDAETGQYDAKVVKKQKTSSKPVSKSVKNIDTGSKPDNVTRNPSQSRSQPQKKPKPERTDHPVFGKIGKDDDGGFDNFDDVVKYEHKMRFASADPEPAPASQSMSQNTPRNTRNSKQRSSIQKLVTNPEDDRPAKRKASSEKTTKKRRRAPDLEGEEDSEAERAAKRSKASHNTLKPRSDKKIPALTKTAPSSQPETRKSTSSNRKRTIEDAELDSDSEEFNNKKVKVFADAPPRQQKVPEAPSKRQSVSKAEEKTVRGPDERATQKKPKKVEPKLVNEPDAAVATKSALAGAPSLASKSALEEDAPINTSLTKASKVKQSHPPSTNGTMKKAAQKTSKQASSSTDSQRKATKNESGSTKQGGSSVSKKPSIPPAKPAPKTVKGDSSRTSQSSNEGSFYDKFSESLEANRFTNWR